MFWGHLEELMIAVVKQAVKDYEEALIKLYYNDNKKNREAVEELKQWFIDNNELYCYKKADVIMKFARDTISAF